jgi:putative FmdB family regulatory protein
MPTYDYRCLSCKHEYEAVQKMSDPPRKRCPKCGKKVERLIGAGAGLLFKGSGFYITDYRSSEYQAKAKAELSEGTKPAADPASSPKDGPKDGPKEGSKEGQREGHKEGQKDGRKDGRKDVPKDSPRSSGRGSEGRSEGGLEPAAKKDGKSGEGEK